MSRLAVEITRYRMALVAKAERVTIDMTHKRLPVALSVTIVRTPDGPGKPPPYQPEEQY